ncbi:HD domain-containing protein [Chryseobacterium sp. MFBS3-17]|uniref:HD domain-containing protein n=1 Tax=Chryseobacterium sp. MFBS3-17 TaxID=2886689 RepID=UPI001D0E8E27|nr:HD domain-containing protein [Chryseobacterium sp. MFBS3-17]MCC2590831.1 HD domain-containing protein [Chryseobacterium sp. MFBS3-17]
MEQIINKTTAFVKETLKGAEAGHDWFHIERVWKMSVHIAASENCNLPVVELAALLHDIADPKFHQGDELLAPQIAGDFLNSVGVDPDVREAVLYIIRNISFKNKSDAPEHPPIELQIVQDADRLDAIGAIGIARTFNFGGFKNNLMHDPVQPPRLHMSKAEYKKSEGTTINHFYEKLLLLKDMMNTRKGREIAAERHRFMEIFLHQFLREWNGEPDR